MSISWKKKYRPELILSKISASRKVSPDGRISFSGLNFQEHLPVLASMLNFPEAANRLNRSSLIWSALSAVQGNLDQDSFKAAINAALRKQLATNLKSYFLVTSISLRSKGLPRSVKMLDATIEFLPSGIPPKFKQREQILKIHSRSLQETPEDYLALRVSVSDKSPTSAAQQAIDRIDLLRGLFALYLNVVMQWSLGSSISYEPINRVRCGSAHTIHTHDGVVATEAVWFEPNFKAAKIYELKTPGKLFKLIKRDVEKIKSSPYANELISSLVKYARAFDEPDANTAFIKLWSALESLITPGVANYESMIKRCSFLYTDGEYHQQVLEHLREYRNRSVHSGIEGDDARTNCFLLQDYFRTAIHFYKHNAKNFGSLEEANEFLDLPGDQVILKARLNALRKAIRFTTPKAGPTE